MRFKDAEGREWICRIDAYILSEMRSEASIDLADPESTDIARIAFDEIALVDALWISCRESAPSPEYTKRQFARVIVGPTLTEAREALEGTLLDFFPPWKRKLLTTQLVGLEVVRTETQQAAETLDVAGQVQEALTQSSTAGDSQGSSV